VFCQPCYQKYFGPTELRVVPVLIFVLFIPINMKSLVFFTKMDEENAKKRSNTDIIKPSDPNQGCPKCKGAVFHAEMVNFSINKSTLILL